MLHLVAAFDKFRGTATAAEVTAAAARAARANGWNAGELPLADGGEGTLYALSHVVGGERRRTRVRGPRGELVEAAWLFLPDGFPEDAQPGASGMSSLLPAESPAGAPVAVVESALAAGRAMLPVPHGDDPLTASTEGVGDLILAAVDAGARAVVVCVGGTATTDGGLGAISAVGALSRLEGAQLVVACDVSTPFRLAAETFAPQKGATPAQVALLRARLDTLADRYRDELGVDVDRLAGAGAAGGLAGGLSTLGGHLVPGFAMVTAVVGLDRRVAEADLVVTGEGRLDATSFDGKVVGGVLAAHDGGVRALCVAGQIEPGVERCWAERKGRVDAVSLVATVGNLRARRTTRHAVFEVVAEACQQWQGVKPR